MRLCTRGSVSAPCAPQASSHELRVCFPRILGTRTLVLSTVTTDAAQKTLDDTSPPTHHSHCTSYTMPEGPQKKLESHYKIHDAQGKHDVLDTQDAQDICTYARSELQTALRYNAHVRCKWAWYARYTRRAIYTRYRHTGHRRHAGRRVRSARRKPRCSRRTVLPINKIHAVRAIKNTKGAKHK